MQLHSRTISDSVLTLQYCKPSHNFAVLTRLFKKASMTEHIIIWPKPYLYLSHQAFLMHALNAQSCQMRTLERLEEWKSVFVKELQWHWVWKCMRNCHCENGSHQQRGHIFWATKIKTRKDITEKWRKKCEEAIVKSIMKKSNNEFQYCWTSSSLRHWRVTFGIIDSCTRRQG